jgi:hypothetical protein
VDSPEARERLLQYLAAGDCLADAAARIGVTRSTIARWRKADPEFAAALEGAYEASTDALEKEARARALNRKDRASAGLLRYLITGRRERWRRLQAEMLAQLAETTIPKMSELEIARRIAFILTSAVREENEANPDGAPPSSSPSPTEER